MHFKLAKYTEGKKTGLIATPDISVFELNFEDDFLIMASDGYKKKNK
jgi:hypothetical protein